MSKEALTEALKHFNGDNTRKAVDVTREIVERAIAELTRHDDKYEALQVIGKSAFDGIAEMVAALECDYDRLTELRDAEYTFHWLVDGYNDSSDWSDGEPHAVWDCIMRTPQGEVCGSLGGIDFGADGQLWGDPYMRVVQAELALENIKEG